MASGDRGSKQPEIAEIRFRQIQIAKPNASKQRVAGSIPVSRSRYDFERVKSFLFRRLRASPYL